MALQLVVVPVRLAFVQRQRTFLHSIHCLWHAAFSAWSLHKNKVQIVCMKRQIKVLVIIAKHRVKSLLLKRGPSQLLSSPVREYVFW